MSQPSQSLLDPPPTWTSGGSTSQSGTGTSGGFTPFANDCSAPPSGDLSLNGSLNEGYLGLGGLGAQGGGPSGSFSCGLLNTATSPYTVTGVNLSLGEGVWLMANFQLYEWTLTPLGPAEGSLEPVRSEAGEVQGYNGSLTLPVSLTIRYERFSCTASPLEANLTSARSGSADGTLLQGVLDTGLSGTLVAKEFSVPRFTASASCPSFLANLANRDGGLPAPAGQAEMGFNISLAGEPGLPVNTALPVISGTAQEGQSLSVSSGSWEGVEPISNAYQWQRCNNLGEECANVEGQTGATYSLTGKDTGATFRVVATATNSDGSTAATSAASRIVAADVGTSIQFGSDGSESGQLSEPGDLALDSGGNVWVADTGNSRIVEFSEKGEVLRTIGSRGSEVGKLESPAALALDAMGDVWVADTGNNRVEEFSASGEYIKTIGVEGTGTLATPEGIAIDSHGNIWVADTSNDRIVEFNESGEFVKAVGSPGTEPGQLERPVALTIDSHGDVWVVDYANSRVEEYSETGEYKQQLGAEGTGIGKFQNPTGIAIDPEGHVYVADPSNDRVEEFSESGEYLRQFDSEGSEGSEPGQPPSASPSAVAVGPGGRICTAEAFRSAIQGWGTGTAPHSTAAPTITGTATVGDLLDAASGSWEGTPAPSSYTYQWQRCNSAGESCTNISGATGSSYQLEAADSGHRLQVVVSAHSSSGQASATSAATAATVSAAYEPRLPTFDYFNEATSEAEPLPQGANYPFTGTGVPLSRERQTEFFNKSLLELGCKTATSTGNNSGPENLTNLIFTFKECSADGLICTSAGQAKATIITESLKGDLDYIYPPELGEEATEAGLLISPEHGTTVAAFTCVDESLHTELHLRIEGSALGRWVPVPLKGGEHPLPSKLELEAFPGTVNELHEHIPACDVAEGEGPCHNLELVGVEGTTQESLGAVEWRATVQLQGKGVDGGNVTPPRPEPRMIWFDGNNKQQSLTPQVVIDNATRGGLSPRAKPSQGSFAAVYNHPLSPFGLLVPSPVETPHYPGAGYNRLEENGLSPIEWKAKQPQKPTTGVIPSAKNWPVVYKREEVMHLQAQLQIDDRTRTLAQAQKFVGEAEFIAETEAFGTKLRFVDKVPRPNQELATNRYQTAELKPEHETPLPNKVGCEVITITWRLEGTQEVRSSPTKQELHVFRTNLGETKHRLYLTYGRPVPSVPVYLTLLDIDSTGAEGAEEGNAGALVNPTENQVIERVWKAFSVQSSLAAANGEKVPITYLRTYEPETGAIQQDKEPLYYLYSATTGRTINELNPFRESWLNKLETPTSIWPRGAERGGLVPMVPDLLVETTGGSTAWAKAFQYALWIEGLRGSAGVSLASEGTPALQGKTTGGAYMLLKNWTFEKPVMPPTGTTWEYNGSNVKNAAGIPGHGLEAPYSAVSYHKVIEVHNREKGSCQVYDPSYGLPENTPYEYTPTNGKCAFEVHKVPGEEMFTAKKAEPLEKLVAEYQQKAIAAYCAISTDLPREYKCLKPSNGTPEPLYLRAYRGTGT